MDPISETMSVQHVFTDSPINHFYEIYEFTKIIFGAHSY